MTAADVLRAARALLKGGWSGPSGESRLVEKSKRSDGSQCLWNDEGVARFSVQGALNQAASASPDADRLVLLAWDQLDRVVSPAWWSGRPDGSAALENWLKDSHRSPADVLRALDRAIGLPHKEHPHA